MATPAIMILGATGNLGMRITRALLKRGAEVSAFVRHGASADKISALQELGVPVKSVTPANRDDLVAAVRTGSLRQP